MTFTPEKNEDASVWVKITSHRARGGVVRILGRRPKEFFSWKARRGHWYQLTEAERRKVAHLKGLRCVSRVPSDLRQTWAF